MNAALRVSLGGEDVVLLGGRALYWPARARLLLADLHLGKADAFRRAYEQRYAYVVTDPAEVDTNIVVVDRDDATAFDVVDCVGDHLYAGLLHQRNAIAVPIRPEPQRVSLCGEDTKPTCPARPLLLSSSRPPSTKPPPTPVETVR